MAKTTFIDVPDELRDQFNKSIEQRDRFIYGVAQGAKRLVPKRRRYELIAQSLFRNLSPFWRALSPEQKLVWRNAAAVSGINGWQLFVSDSASRLKNELEIGIPPSSLWQVRIGLIEIESPATSILLHQDHARDYLEAVKRRGQPWKFDLLELRENFSLPLNIQCRYFNDLTPEGSNQVARFYAEVETSYQSKTIFHTIEIPFSVSGEWTYETATLDNVRGIIIGYRLFLEIRNYRGKLMIDNLRAVHSGTNWVRDPRMDNMQKVFEKAFRLVQPYWVPDEMPEGASYRTIFEPLVITE